MIPPLTALHVIETLEAVGGTPRKLLALTRATRSLDIPLRHELIVFRAGGLEPEFRTAGARVIVAGTTHPVRLALRLRGALQSQAHPRTVVVSHFVRALLVARLAGGRDTAHMHMIHGASEISSVLSRAISRAFLSGVDLVVANSQFTRSQLERKVHLNDTSTEVIHNPVPRREPTGTVEWPNWIGSGPIVLTVGGLIPLRRHDVLLRAFKIIASEVPAARLVVVGDGPLRREMAQLSRDLDIDRHTWFAGYQSHIGDFLARANVFVSAADAEGFGIAVGEALLSGTPVVLPANAVYEELYGSLGFGYYFEPGDPTQLARTALAVLRSPRDPTRDQDLSVLEASYSADRYARCFFEAAEGLLSRRASGDPLP